MILKIRSSNILEKRDHVEYSNKTDKIWEARCMATQIVDYLLIYLGYDL